MPCRAGELSSVWCRCSHSSAQNPHNFSDVLCANSPRPGRGIRELVRGPLRPRTRADLQRRGMNLPRGLRAKLRLGHKWHTPAHSGRIKTQAIAAFVAALENSIKARNGARLAGPSRKPPPRLTKRPTVVFRNRYVHDSRKTAIKTLAWQRDCGLTALDPFPLPAVVQNLGPFHFIICIVLQDRQKRG